jgi:hypothetical protein
LVIESLRLQEQATLEGHQIIRTVVIGRAAFQASVGCQKAGALEVGGLGLIIDSLDSEFLLTGDTSNGKIKHIPL